jgi:hypothetical protein
MEHHNIWYLSKEKSTDRTWHRVSHIGGTVLEGTEIIQQGDDHSMMKLYIWMIGFSRFFWPLSLVGARKMEEMEWSDWFVLK